MGVWRKIQKEGTTRTILHTTTNNLVLKRKRFEKEKKKKKGGKEIHTLG